MRDVNLSGKKVLMRVDFNVPLDKKTKEITDDTRIAAAAPTIQHVAAQGAIVVLASHLGGQTVNAKWNTVLRQPPRAFGRIIRTKGLVCGRLYWRTRQNGISGRETWRCSLVGKCAFLQRGRKNIPNLRNNWPRAWIVS